MSQQPYEHPFFEDCVDYFLDLQRRIIEDLERVGDGTKFRVDSWERDPLPAPDDVPTHLEEPLLSGSGRTCVLEDGAVFEKAGVNFSDVRGYFSSEFAGALPGDARSFRAAGVSLVIHPRNPYVPTVHMNVRHIQRGDRAWFGGGADLTPYYLDRDDARHFHQQMHAACAAHPTVGDYPDMKRQCDEYFYIPHRKEARGIGGIFFDYLDTNPDESREFIKSVGDSFLPAYIPLVEKHKDRTYTDKERQWQLYRRGRYVEFNLVYDRGTTFGLKTGGRIESILMSLPLNVQWRYDHSPTPGSPEAELLEGLVPRDWLGEV